MSRLARPLRCAIYTRKSSEEGLEQDFNSLHAQREACAAYIASQRHEGWAALPDAYDDGGFSGGSMERPGLQRLLADIALGKIDVVVVYKVDRLTRALTDFAKIVEAFDAKGVSFVSVTQAFNTTSSMGRLTLNVLLSFAQFEREVTGERIRDKIAASKKKGLWMGGHVPIGYDARDRTLAINEPEAATVRMIFTCYLELRSVDVLKAELDVRGVTTKQRGHIAGRMRGGGPFSRGHLYALLANPLYIGCIRHKDQIHPGQHPPIVGRTMWDEVQQLLAANRRKPRGRRSSRNPSMLAGLLFDASGERLVATHAVKKGQRYRYYVSASAIGARKKKLVGDQPAANGRQWRLPAAEIEAAVRDLLVSRLQNPLWIMEHAASAAIDVRQTIIERAAKLAERLQSDDVEFHRDGFAEVLAAVRVDAEGLTLSIRAAALASATDHEMDPAHRSDRLIDEHVPLRMHRRGVETRLIVEGVEKDPRPPDPALLKALARAHRWWADLRTGRYQTLRELAIAYQTDERYAARVLRLAFLPQSIKAKILAGDDADAPTVKELFA
ncbi:MAG: site-specific recombinase, invertase Pin s [Xanthobacteraceae bacterium]|jgi:DNA invertase Pin-like site-specific DNA recombinase|nr:site-specific recombinase, invertase Pin s [Xanthobacteraceae bacterium]